MKKIIIFCLCFIPMVIWAQNTNEIESAYKSYDFEKVILLTDNHCDSACVMTRINSLKALNRYNQAIDELNALSCKDSTNLTYCVGLAECYKLINNNLKAAELYNKAKCINPNNRYFLLQKIKSLIIAEKNDSAISACHEWLSKDTISAIGYKYLGLAYENNQNIPYDFISYSMAYRRDSTDNMVVMHIANIFNNNKQYDDAISITEKYRLKDTTNLSINRQNARAYCLKGDYKNAIKRYESLKLAGDNSASTYYYLGLSYYGDNWFYGAYENLIKAVEKSPNDVNILYYLAKSCVRTSWKKDGEEYMERAVEVTVPTDSTMIWLYKGLIDCYGYSQNATKKVEVMKMLFNINKDYSLLNKIADIYYYKKDYNNAISFYERYMASVPKDMRYTKLNENGEKQDNVTTKYLEAERKIKKIKAENFFKNNKK